MEKFEKFEHRMDVLAYFDMDFTEFTKKFGKIAVVLKNGKTVKVDGGNGNLLEVVIAFIEKYRGNGIKDLYIGGQPFGPEEFFPCAWEEWYGGQSRTYYSYFDEMEDFVEGHYNSNTFASLNTCEVCIKCY